MSMSNAFLFACCLPSPYRESALSGMRGIEMEMYDGNFPLLQKMMFTTDDAQAFKGADYAILLGAFPKQDGIDKRDIMEKNVMIFRTMGKALDKHVKPDCKVLVVGNPAHTNAWICASMILLFFFFFSKRLLNCMFHDFF